MNNIIVTSSKTQTICKSFDDAHTYIDSAIAYNIEFDDNVKVKEKVNGKGEIQIIMNDFL